VIRTDPAVSAARKARRRAKAKLLYSGKPKKVTFKKADALAWKECSLYIRERDWKRYGVCYWCEAAPIEHATHLIPRGKRGTKFDERNVFGGCATCNFKDSRVPGYHDSMVNIFIRKNGASLYQELVALSEQPVLDQKAADLLAIASGFKSKRENLGPKL
jgi:hypothetical protein